MWGVNQYIVKYRQLDTVAQTLWSAFINYVYVYIYIIKYTILMLPLRQGNKRSQMLFNVFLCSQLTICSPTACLWPSPTQLMVLSYVSFNCSNWACFSCSHSSCNTLTFNVTKLSRPRSHSFIYRITFQFQHNNNQLWRISHSISIFNIHKTPHMDYSQHHHCWQQVTHEEMVKKQTQFWAGLQ